MTRSCTSERSRSALKKLKVAQTAWMDYHVKSRDTIVTRMLRYTCFSAYLMPLPCWEEVSSNLDVLAASLQNLMQCDVVSTEMHLLESYAAQLSYHAPHLKGSRHLNYSSSSATSRINVGSSRKQILSAEALTIISSWPEFQVSSVLYEVAKAVATERDARAAECTRGNSNRACETQAPCSVRMAAEGQSLLTRAVPISCRLPRALAHLPEISLAASLRTARQYG
jgi:hypothetical protein